MNKTEETGPGSEWRVAGTGREVDAEGKEAGPEDGVPLSVRKAREMRRDLWPNVWISFASIIILAAALAILSYRIAAQTCH
jgi:hypothetical protein